MYNTVDCKGKKGKSEMLYVSIERNVADDALCSDSDSNSVGGDNHHCARVLLSNLEF